jgi:ABC-type transport system substrate-binding protein
VIRGKIKGLEKFREACSKTPKGDNSVYDKPCDGFEIIDDRNFVLHLTKPDPRFLYVLAMPYSSVVSRKAVEKYGESFSEHPVGSGPFKLKEWIRDYSITMERNDGYRQEFFASAENPADRKRKLPLLDKVVCYLVKQPLANWLLFLQGELDMSALNKDNFDAVVGLDLKLSPSLKKRGIKLLQIPEFQINYVGFCFADPLLAENADLRKAISLAYNVEKRIKHFNYRLVPAHGPIPPGVAGHDRDFRNPYSSFDIEKAKEYMVKAGYPNGIDPKTGKHLELSFDQMGASPNHRQLAELMAVDMQAIGIKIKPVLNNKSRFLQKSRKGQLQLFKIGWVGDYPDAENFLQLFYGKNAGSCNRSFYRDKKFDAMFEEIISMPDTPARTRKYSEMAKYLASQCPWIFESHPIAYKLLHSWLQNYIPHDFAYSSWKYLSVDVKARREAKSSFEPLELEDLRK